MGSDGGPVPGVTPARGDKTRQTQMRLGQNGVTYVRPCGVGVVGVE